MWFRAVVDFEYHDQRGRPLPLRPGQLVDVLTRQDAEALLAEGKIISRELSHKTTDKLLEPSPGSRRAAVWLETTPYYSGGRVYLYQLAWALARAGLETWVVTNSRPTWADDYPEVQGLHLAIDGRDALPPDLGAVVIETKGPAARRGMEFRSRHCPCAPLVCVTLETPNWASAMGRPETDDLASRMVHEPYRDVANAATHHLAISALSAHYLREWLGDGSGAPIEVLYPAVNTYAVGLARPERIVPGDRPYAVWCARNVPYKQLDVAVHAVEAIDGPMDLVVLGQASGLGRRNGQHAIHVLEDLSDAQKYAVLRDARVVLHPSLMEGFGLVPGEAMAVGTPSVVYDLPVLREVYGDRLVYVPYGDADAYIDAVRRLDPTPDDAREASRAWVRDTYGLDAFARRVAALSWARPEKQSLAVTTTRTRPLWFVIPTYNRADALMATLDRVGAQRIEGDRIIVVDDGSIDGTTARLYSRAATDPGSNLVRFAKNLGVNAARRAGTALVPPGEIVVELDDHDEPAPDMAERIARAFEDPGTSFVYGDCELRHTDGHIETSAKPEYVPWLFRETRCWSGGIRAYRQELYEAAGGWRLGEYPGGDYALALRMEQHLGGTGFCRIPHVLTRVTWGADGISTRDRVAQADAAIRYRQAAQEAAPPPPLTMRVGITSPWRPQGLATMAVQLGRLVESLGGAWEVFPFARRESMGPTLDTHVTTKDFRDWVETLDVLVMLEHIDPAWIAGAESAGVPCAFVPMLEWFVGDVAELAERVDVVVAPCRLTECALAGRRLRHTVCVPWAVDLAPVGPEPHTDHGRLRLLHNASMPRSRRHTALAIEIFLGLVDAGLDVELRLKAQEPFDKVRGFAPDTFRRELDAIAQAQQLNGRFIYDVREASTGENLALYRQADLLVYTSAYDGIGLMVQEALHCGLPVLAPDVPPVNEWVGPDNGVLVPCRLDPSNRGVPFAWPDVSVAIDRVVRLGRDGIAALRSGCHRRLVDRQRAWREGWTALLQEMKGK